MTINYTTNLSLAEPVTGTQSGTWGDDVNKGITDYLDIAIAGTLALTSASFTANALTLANTQGSSAGNNIGATTAQYYVLKTSSLAANVTITAPSSSKSYIVVNLDPTYTVTIKASGQTGVTIPVSSKALVVFNGTDYTQVGASAGGSTGQVQYNSAGALAGSANMTFDGTKLTVAGLKDSALTSGRVPYATTSGELTDSTNLTFNGTALTANTLTPTNAVGVAYGGTGLQTATAYSVVFTGTTSTGAFQASAGPGTSGYVLTSNGAGALPTWQAASGGVSQAKSTAISMTLGF